MSVDQVLEDCRRVKEAGTSSKVPVPIIVLEKLCADAKMWAETPAYVRDVVEALRASK
jgi:hypothetical protein